MKHLQSDLSSLFKNDCPYKHTPPSLSGQPFAVPMTVKSLQKFIYYYEVKHDLIIMRQHNPNSLDFLKFERPKNRRKTLKEVYKNWFILGYYPSTTSIFFRHHHEAIIELILNNNTKNLTEYTIQQTKLKYPEYFI